MVVVAVDIDEVLAPMLFTMKKWKYPKKLLPPRYPYVYKDIFRIPQSQSAKMVRDFYQTEEFRTMKPIHGSQTALKNLTFNSDFTFYVVSGRQDFVYDETCDWINYWYPGVFKDVILTDSYTPREIRKSDVCKSINAAAIIDDSHTICMDCNDSGIVPLNFIGDPVYPWCFYNPWAVHNWSETTQHLLYCFETC